MLCYVDDLLQIGFKPKEDTDALNIIYWLKEGFVPPDLYLGENVEKVQLNNGRFESDYAMKIMESWMTLYELEGARTRRHFIDRSGTKDMKQFKHRQQFGIHFRYIHQVENNNNCRHAPIYLERKWATKF